MNDEIIKKLKEKDWKKYNNIDKLIKKQESKEKLLPRIISAILIIGMGIPAIFTIDYIINLVNLVQSASSKLPFTFYNLTPSAVAPFLTSHSNSLINVVLFNLNNSLFFFMFLFVAIFAIGSYIIISFIYYTTALYVPHDQESVKLYYIYKRRIQKLLYLNEYTIKDYVWYQNIKQELETIKLMNKDII